MLRAGPDEPGEPAGAVRPQPTPDDLPRPAEQAHGAGTPVRPERRTAPAPAPPEVVGRTVYRVVREGSTNVREHAPGAEAPVTVVGAPGDGLTVRVSNRRAAAPQAARVPGWAGWGSG